MSHGKLYCGKDQYALGSVVPTCIALGIWLPGAVVHITSLTLGASYLGSICKWFIYRGFGALWCC